MWNKNKDKVFCIGLNKTGTTTLEKVLKDFGFKLGIQAKAELLVHDWYKRDFRSIISYCNNAEAFQDIPFSLPFTYMFLDQYFKKSKFILTIRDNPEQWYNSITRFHSKIWAEGKSIPTVEDLKNAHYLYQGFPYELNRYMFNTPKNEPYKKENLLGHYNNHNHSVIEYFRSQPDKLIVINVSVDNDYGRLCNFLNKKPTQNSFPWENKTS